MSLVEFQNSKIELAKLVLDLESVALLRKIQNFIKDEKMSIENSRNFTRQEENREEIRNNREDMNGARTISANDFVIKLS